MKLQYFNNHIYNSHLPFISGKKSIYKCNLFKEYDKSIEATEQKTLTYIYLILRLLVACVINKYNILYFSPCHSSTQAKACLCPANKISRTVCV